MTDIIAPIPATPCADCLNDPQIATDEAVIVYCDHARTGGLYIPVVGLWEWAGPFQSEEQFRRWLQATVTAKAKLDVPPPHGYN